MKVGIFYSGTSPKSGGGYTYEQDLLLSFVSVAHESHHEFSIISTADITDLISASSQKSIQNIVIPGNSIISTSLRYLFSGQFFSKMALKFSKLNRIIKKNRLEMIIFLSPAPEIVECPYITPVWDLQHRLQPWFPEVNESGIWDWRERHYHELLKRATWILTGTSEGQEEISFFYSIPKNHIKILPLPTPQYCLSDKKPKNRDDIKKFELPGDYLLYPAQFWAHKNHINAILALRILHEKYNLPLTLVLVGSDKGNLSHITDFASIQGLSDHVKCLGFVSREDLISLYQNAYSLIFPTFFGPDNIPVLEAFAFRCPVIASDVPGAEEQLGDAAIRFDPTNPEEIADAVYKLSTTPDLRSELLNKGYKRAAGWTGNEYMRQVFSLLDSFEKIRRCWK